MIDVTQAPAGVRAHVSPGDLVFTTGDSIVNRLVWAGQLADLVLVPPRMPWNDARRWARWDHVAWVYDADSVVEALPPMVRRAPLARFDDRRYAVAHMHMHPHDLAQARRLVDGDPETGVAGIVGAPYAWRHYIGLLIGALTAGRANYSDTRAMICSALAADLVARGDMIWPRRPAAMTPAVMALHTNAAPPGST